MQRYFYILSSQQSDKYYLGHTCDDLTARIQKDLTTCPINREFLDYFSKAENHYELFSINHLLVFHFFRHLLTEPRDHAYW